MTTIVEVRMEKLTAEAFAPYGQLIAASEAHADYARPLLEVWHLDYRADAPARIQIMRYHEQPMTFRRLERHVRVTEGRIPLAGARAVLAVAGADRRGVRLDARPVLGACVPIRRHPAGSCSHRGPGTRSTAFLSTRPLRTSSC